MVTRVRRLGGVLAEAWPTWLAIVGVVVALGTGRWLASTNEASIRYAGITLQLLGLGTVAIGLSQVRRIFGRPSIVERLRGWIAHLASVFWRRRPANIHMSAGVGGLKLTGGAAGLTLRAGPDTPIERRVAILENTVDALQTQIDDAVTAIRTRLAELHQLLESEASDRRSQDERTARHLEEFAVGGLHLEEVGLLWLALGVIGASMPAELVLCLQILASR